MLGDSHTEGIDWRELFPDVKILIEGLVEIPVRVFLIGWRK
jgi:hypothetical protein